MQYLRDGGPIRWQGRGTDTVPAMLTPGEGVVTTRGMQALGADGLAALNDGQGIAPIVNVYVTVDPMTGQVLKETIEVEGRRNLALGRWTVPSDVIRSTAGTR